MSYVLSICMMVKNEELHIKRCLESLKPIIDRKDVELIIVDTGSKDNTVKIAKDYTDKLFFREWFNDFSGMRNVTISYATGEWLFLIDADETLESVDEFNCLLENIVESSTKINTFFLKAKNYTNLKDLSNYAIMTTPRLFRNDGNFRYEGVVHNQPIYSNPIDYVDIYLGHYGYITGNKKIMDEKFYRTSKLLIQELNKNPNNLYYLFQLANSYNMHGDIKKSYEVSKKTVNLLEKYSHKEQMAGFPIYSIHISNCTILEKYSELIDTSKSSIKLRDDYVDAYFALAYGYEKLGNIELAKEFSIKFLNLCEIFSSLDISKEDAIIIYRNNQATINRVKQFLASYFIKREEYSQGLDYLSNQNIDNNNLNLYLTAYFSLNDYKLIKELYGRINSIELKNRILDYIEQNIKNLDLLEKNKIRSFFIDCDEIYSLFYNFSMLSHSEYLYEKIKIANTILKKIDKKEVRLYYPEIMAYLIIYNEVNLNLFSKFESKCISFYIDYLNENYYEAYTVILKWLEIVDIKQITLKNRFTLYIIFKNIIFNFSKEYKNTGVENIISDNLHLFIKYLDIGIDCMLEIYSNDGLSIKYEYIQDNEHKFLLVMYLFKESKKNNLSSASLRYYKIAADVYPELADFLKNNLELEGSQII